MTRLAGAIGINLIAYSLHVTLLGIKDAKL